MITIGTPYVEINKENARLICDISFSSSNESIPIWIEVNHEYVQYLCDERSDAFLILLLPLAMQRSEDITCKTPVTEELLYNITTYLIPSLAKHSEQLYATKIYASNAPCLKNHGSVGTGCSCGIDSFHVIANQLNPPYPSLKLTHLCLFYTIIHNKKNDAIFQKQLKRSSRVAAELDLPLVVCNSNCYQVVPVPEHFNFLHTFSSMFVVFSLQKLWKTYFYASTGYDFSHFSIKNAENTDCGFYDLLTLSCLSTSNLKLYSEGGAENRMEKTCLIADSSIAQKYLKVCNDNADNCGKCGKCMRTMLSLDTTGKLDKFRAVFDVDYYRSHQEEYLYWLFKQHVTGDLMNEPIYEKFKNSPIIDNIRCTDPVWGQLCKATGIYTDAWLKSDFIAKSQTGATGTMIVSIYIADITPSNTITMIVNRKQVFQETLVTGSHTIRIKVPTNTIIDWELHSSCSIVPADNGISEDVRQLSIILSKIEMT